MPAVMRICAAILCACVLAGSLTAVAGDKGVTVSGVRYFSYPGFTRIVLELEGAAPYVLTKSGDGRSLSFAAYDGPLTVDPARLPVIQDGVVGRLEAQQEGDRKFLSIGLAPVAGDFKDFVLRGPDRIVIDIQRGVATQPVLPDDGLPVVVIDPGHGGTQRGIAGGRDVEKTVTLELALAIRKKLRAGSVKMKVVLTREADRVLSLDERAAAANAAGASVFVSLHQGWDASAHVFILDPDEGRTVSAGGGPADFLEFDAVNQLHQALWGTQQAKHAPESSRLGRLLIRSLSGRESGDPEQAPLALLRSVDAPAALVEAGMGQDRSGFADEVARGIEQYVREKR